MSSLKAPPKVSRKVMILAAAVLGVLAALSVLLLAEELLPPALRDVARAVKGALPQEDPQQREAFQNRQEQAREAIADNVENPRYRRQLERHVNAATDEAYYLDLRQWSVWHIMVPLFALIAAIVLLLRWRRRKLASKTKPHHGDSR